MLIIPSGATSICTSSPFDVVSTLLSERTVVGTPVLSCVCRVAVGLIDAPQCKGSRRPRSHLHVGSISMSVTPDFGDYAGIGVEAMDEFSHIGVSA